jgi:hypothetical protein
VGNNKKRKALGEVSQATEGALYERNGIVYARGHGGMDTQLGCDGVAVAERVAIRRAIGRLRLLASPIGQPSR